MDKKKVILVIPTLNPQQRLIELLEALKTCWQDPVLLIDDGSDASCASYFEKAEEMGCVVEHHAVNMGKGRGLKNAFNYCLTHWPDAIGCVTADSDGQHTPEDICACAEALRNDPQALIMGCRQFDGKDVPLRSSFGNKVTSWFMRVLCGVSVSDTQTGLRGISTDFMRHMLTVKGERFEYETNMLLETATEEVPIKEVPIATVYIEENRSSHFHPLRDSWRIYKQFGKFIFASLSATLLDILLFIFFTNSLLVLGMERWRCIVLATAAARIFSATANFTINHLIVFRSKRKAASSLWRYATLCVLQMGASALFVSLLAMVLPIYPAVIKVIVDMILFFISFQIQRKFVFAA